MTHKILRALTIIGCLSTFTIAMAADKGQSGPREFQISLRDLNSACHIKVHAGMQLNDIFSARLPKGAIQTSITNDKFIIQVPDIKKLVHQEVDDEATFAGKVLDMDLAKNNGKGVTLFRTFYRDSDDTFYLRCQPTIGKIFGETYKLNSDGTLTQVLKYCTS